MQLGVLAVGHGLPSGTEDLFENRICEQMVRRSGLQSINSRAQRADRTERICDVKGGSIDYDRLSGRRVGTCNPKNEPKTDD